MTTSAVTISSGSKSYGAKPRATINMDTSNPNAPVTISVKTRERDGRGSWKNINTTYTQGSDGMFRGSDGKIWSEEYSGGGGIVRSAMGKILMKSNPSDETIKEFGSNVTGAYTKDIRDEVAAGANAKGNDPGETIQETPGLDQQFRSELAARAPKRQYYGNYRYPSTMMDGISDYMKIGMHEYIPGKFNASNRATDRMRGSRTMGTVLLPIPPGLADANTADWSANSMNQLQLGGAAAASRVMNSQNFGTALKKEASSALDALKENAGISVAAKALLLGKLPGMEGGTAGVLGRGQGKIINPNMELLFGGPALRSFNYTFRLTPRNPEDTRQCKNIIRFFKQGMSVKASPGGLFMDAPNVFSVKFYHGSGGQHTFIHRIKMCACTSFTVNYVPDGTYMTLPDSSMTAYDIGMSFQEMDPILDSDYGSTNEIGY